MDTGTRWTRSLKATVLARIASGEITEDDAMSRYAIGTEELAEWRRLLAEFGQNGLRAERTQHYHRLLRLYRGIPNDDI